MNSSSANESKYIAIIIDYNDIAQYYFAYSYIGIHCVLFVMSMTRSISMVSFSMFLDILYYEQRMF